MANYAQKTEEYDIIIMEGDNKIQEDKEFCPVCGGNNLIKEGRCTTCMDCFWSKCDI